MSHIIEYIHLFKNSKPGDRHPLALLAPSPTTTPPSSSSQWRPADWRTCVCFRVVERGGAPHQHHPAGGGQEGGAVRTAGAGDAAHRHHRAAPQRCTQRHLGQEHQEVPGQGQRSTPPLPRGLECEI